VALSLSACGGGARQDANEPSGNFPVAVSSATFPTSQRLAEHTRMVISVRNAGSKTIPDIAVTITDPGLKDPTSASAFGGLLSNTGSSQGLASLSRPIWIVDRPPGQCSYSCKSGGPGGAVTAYANTWALGALRPGATATFQWGLTAVKPGSYTIQYRVAAELNGKAHAVLQGGGIPSGRFSVTVSHAPSQSYVNDKGQVVKTG
jgi:hypothetical protein